MRPISGLNGLKSWIKKWKGGVNERDCYVIVFGFVYVFNQQGLIF